MYWCVQIFIYNFISIINMTAILSASLLFVFWLYHLFFIAFFQSLPALSYFNCFSVSHIITIVSLFLCWYFYYLGFPGGFRGKEPCCQCRRHKRHGFYPWVRELPWSRKWQPTLVFLPGKLHRQKSLAGCESMGPQRVGHN